MIKVKSKENEKNGTGVKTKAKHPILKGIKNSVKGVVVVSLIAISVVVAYFVGDHFVSQKRRKMLSNCLCKRVVSKIQPIKMTKKPMI